MKQLGFFSFLLLIACWGCGYRFSNEREGPGNHAALSIPYVCGDHDGALTAALVREVVRSGNFRYRDHGGTLILHVTLVDLSEDNIGFRYDRKREGLLLRRSSPPKRGSQELSTSLFLRAHQGRRLWVLSACPQASIMTMTTTSAATE